MHGGSKSVGVFSLVDEGVFTLALPGEGACESPKPIGVAFISGHVSLR